MPALPIISGISAVAGIGSTIAGMSAQKTAASRAAQAAKDNAIDPAKVAGLAHDQAIRNAHDSAALEKELNPLAPELRTNSLQAIIDGLKGNNYDDAIKAGLTDEFNNGSGADPQFQDYDQSALSQAAQQKAMEELALGGNLDQETINQVMRSSAAKAGAFGGGLGLGRDLSARDLGLTSRQLLTDRLQRAQSFGRSQDEFTAGRAGARNSFGLNAAQLALQRHAQRQGLGFGLQGLSGSNYLRALQAAQLGQSIEQPVTGLDPGAIANLSVGASNANLAAQQNAASIKAQQGQGQAKLGGQLFGMGASLFKPGAAAPSASYTPPVAPWSMAAPNPATPYTAGFGIPSAGSYKY